MPTQPMRNFATISLFALTLLAQAQPRIIAHTSIIANPAAVIGPEHEAVLAEAGMDEAALTQFLASDAIANWPTGLRSDSARQVHAKAISNYTVHIMAELSTAESRVIVVRLPSMENLHMPDDLRNGSDLYLAVLPEGIDNTERAVKRPAPSPGPSWSSMPKARIMRPDAVYATYDLASDPDAMASLERKGMSPAEMDAVIFRSHQRNWPAGIDAFEKRWSKLKNFRRYKVFKAAQWEDKVLLVIPAEPNRNLPEGLRPPLDIYMVYAAPAVSVKDK